MNANLVRGPTSTATLGPDACRQAGAALRRDVPRSAQGEWAPPADRADPVEILIEQGKSRIQELLPIRYARMRADPFAFLRGAAAVMAADLANTPTTGIRMQACGDAHLANFGSYATPEGLPVFDINDFDETLPAPFEWDLKRPATSLVVEFGWHQRLHYPVYLAEGLTNTALSNCSEASVTRTATTAPTTTILDGRCAIYWLPLSGFFRSQAQT